MRTEFVGFPEAQDQSATLMCYLMELNLHHAIITNVADMLVENIGTGILTVLVSKKELDHENDQKLQKYDPIRLSDIVVWSFECVQLLADEFTDAELNPALRTLVEARYSLQPYTGGKKKAPTAAMAKRTMELIMHRLTEAAKRATITIGDEILRAKYQVQAARDILASLIDEQKTLEIKRDKLYEMFKGKDNELEKAQLQQAASVKLNEIRALFESGSVIDMKMMAETLEVTTKPIMLEYPEGSNKMWPMGNFLIKIPWQGTNVAILQPDQYRGPCRAWHNTCPAPHVSGSGGVCWGSWATKMLADQLGKAEYAAFISMTNQWLTCYNDESPYMHFPHKEVKIEGRKYYDPREGGWIDPDLCEKFREAGVDPSRYDFSHWTPEIGIPKPSPAKV